MAGGRPTKYDKAFCKIVEKEMSEGASKIEVCAEIGICYETFLNWGEKHKEFSESIKRGNDLSRAWWEKKGRVNLENNAFSATLWYMNMKNRHGWRDKQEIDNTHSVKPTDLLQAFNEVAKSLEQPQTDTE